MSILWVPRAVCGTAWVTHHYMSNPKLMSEIQWPSEDQRKPSCKTQRSSGKRSESEAELTHLVSFDEERQGSPMGSMSITLTMTVTSGEHWVLMKALGKCRAVVSAKALEPIGFGPRA